MTPKVYPQQAVYTDRPTIINIIDQQQNQPLTDKTATAVCSNTGIRRLPTLYSALFLLFAWITNNVALAWIHERVPRDSPPLPDLWFSLFPEITGAIHITEYVMIALLASASLIIVCHQHRWLVSRRIFYITALCYLYRAVCITLIQVPVPSVKTFCAPKSVHTDLQLVMRRVTDIFLSAGMETFRLRELCGDLIVSGHTISLFIAALTFKEYAPKRLAPIAHLLHLCAFVGVVCILLARKHYTIDVVLGYALTTYNFATYHTLAMLANGGDLVDRLPITKVGLWSSAVRYFEWDSPPTIVNRLQWPSSCPQLIRKRCA